MTFRPAVLIPTYNNPRTIRDVVEAARVFIPDVFVVDDGSHDEARSVLDAIAADRLAEVLRRAQNGGKGAAIKTGLLALLERGFTHAVAIDADGQHNVQDIPRFVELARKNPNALVLGSPVFDESAPSARLYGRKITQIWTNIETLGEVILDPLCGFRCYPVAAAASAGVVGNAMDFDPEIVVRLAWQGLPVINVHTRVRYFDRDQGGVSHFRMWRDNLLISWMHTRQVCSLVHRVFTRPRPRRLVA